MQNLRNLLRAYRAVCACDGFGFAYIVLAFALLAGLFSDAGNVGFSAAAGLLAGVVTFVRLRHRYLKADRADRAGASAGGSSAEAGVEPGQGPVEHAEPAPRRSHIVTGRHPRLQTVENLIRVHGIACAACGFAFAYVWLACTALAGGWFDGVGNVVLSAVLGALAAVMALVYRWRRFVRADRAIEREIGRA